MHVARTVHLMGQSLFTSYCSSCSSSYCFWFFLSFLNCQEFYCTCWTCYWTCWASQEFSSPVKRLDSEPISVASRFPVAWLAWPRIALIASKFSKNSSNWIVPGYLWYYDWNLLIIAIRKLLVRKVCKEIVQSSSSPHEKSCELLQVLEQIGPRLSLTFQAISETSDIAR